MKIFKITAGSKIYEFVLASDGNFEVDGKPSEVAVLLERNGLYRIRLGPKIYDVFCKKTPANTYDVWINHHVIPVSVEDAQSLLLSQYQKAAALGHTKFEIRAPMPGLVTSISATLGQIVDKETRLLTLEAMKMENEIRSPIHGKITRIEVEKSSKVEKDQKLIVLETI